MPFSTYISLLIEYTEDKAAVLRFQSELFVYYNNGYLVSKAGDELLELTRPDAY